LNLALRSTARDPINRVCRQFRATQLIRAADYFEHASAALREMSVQRPVLETGPDGAARRGLIVRHLVLPGAAEDSRAILAWMHESLSPYIGLS
jgi:putative pyruvate formate lyase activating enzyme